MQKKRLTLIVFIVVVLLLIPFIAMQFSTDVNWGLFDFVVAALLLLGTGLLIEWASRKIKPRKYKIAVISLVVVALLVTWAELAVGLF